MSHDLMVFQFKNSSIRTFEWNGVIKFVAKDVADILLYIEPHKAIQRHCKNPVALNELKKQWDETNYCNEINELHPRSLIIEESDVFRLIINSQMEEAEKFENWLMEEVLPTIRKTGQY